MSAPSRCLSPPPRTACQRRAANLAMLAIAHRHYDGGARRHGGERGAAHASLCARAPRPPPAVWIINAYQLMILRHAAAARGARRAVRLPARSMSRGWSSSRSARSSARCRAASARSIAARAAAGAGGRRDHEHERRAGAPYPSRQGAWPGASGQRVGWLWWRRPIAPSSAVPRSPRSPRAPWGVAVTCVCSLNVWLGGSATPATAE